MSENTQLINKYLYEYWTMGMLGAEITDSRLQFVIMVDHYMCNAILQAYTLSSSGVVGHDEIVASRRIAQSRKS